MEDLKITRKEYDRIDVSTLSDENYVGLGRCLELSAPLLKIRNPHSRLVTTLMNWIAGTKFLNFMSTNPNLKNYYKIKALSEKESGDLFLKIL